jgi:hypothetical protein
MNDGIDNKKLESCMLELYGNPLLTQGTITTKIRYLTISGLPIVFFSSKNFFPRDLIDKDIQLFLELDERHYVRQGGHVDPIRWSVGLYLTKYKTEIKEDADRMPPDRSRVVHKDGKILGVPQWDRVIKKLRLLSMNSMEWIQRTKMCRLGWSGTSRRDLNIAVGYPLTHSQRRFLLDYIEVYHISPDRIYIDDYSSSKRTGTVKRQLGLQFF